MRQALKKYFIPHAENNYHPHMLHTKRLFFYGMAVFAIKGFVVLLSIMLPLEAFLMPDVLEEQRKEIIELTNALRTKPLSENARLNRSAALKTNDMARREYFGHVGPNRRNLAFFLSKAGYNYEVAGENLAVGFLTAADVVEAWKKSPTHFENLVDPAFRDIGVALRVGTYEGIPMVYVAEHFGDSGFWPPLLSKRSLRKTNVLDAEVISPTLFEKYAMTQKFLNRGASFVRISKITYALLFVVFSVALLLNIFVEIRKQHPHIILKSALLLFLIAVMYIV